jgi:hypothetical protein
LHHESRFQSFNAFPQFDALQAELDAEFAQKLKVREDAFAKQLADAEEAVRIEFEQAAQKALDDEQARLKVVCVMLNSHIMSIILIVYDMCRRISSVNVRHFALKWSSWPSNSWIVLWKMRNLDCGPSLTPNVRLCSLKSPRHLPLPLLVHFSPHRKKIVELIRDSHHYFFSIASQGTAAAKQAMEVAAKAAQAEADAKIASAVRAETEKLKAQMEKEQEAFRFVCFEFNDFFHYIFVISRFVLWQSRG